MVLWGGWGICIIFLYFVKLLDLLEYSDSVFMCFFEFVFIYELIIINNINLMIVYRDIFV